jgi:hypothetical protein
LSPSSGPLPIFFSTSWTKTEQLLVWRGTNRWERCSSGKVAKIQLGKNKSGGDAELGRTWSFRIGGSGKGASLFMAAVGLQRSFNQPGIWCRQHGTQQGQPVRSQRREYGCGKRLRSGVTVSYNRNTDDDEVQRSKELTVMWKRTRKAQCTMLHVRDSNKEKLSNSFCRSWVYFLARF